MRFLRRILSFSRARPKSYCDTKSVSRCDVIHLSSVDMPTPTFSGHCSAMPYTQGIVSHLLACKPTGRRDTHRIVVKFVLLFQSHSHSPLVPQILSMERHQTVTGPMIVLSGSTLIVLSGRQPAKGRNHCRGAQYGDRAAWVDQSRAIIESGILSLGGFASCCFENLTTKVLLRQHGVKSAHVKSAKVEIIISEKDGFIHLL